MKSYRNKYFCNNGYTKYINSEYYDELNGLLPVWRSAARFRLMLENLPVHFEPGDRFCGHFGFEKIPEATPAAPFEPVYTMPDSIREKKERLKSIYNTRAAFDRGHVTVDYGTILTHGLKYYENLADASAASQPESEMPAAMRDTIRSLRDFCERIAEDAEKHAMSLTGSDAADLIRIAEMMRHVPYEPARTFLEAIQSVWIIHFAVPLAASAWFSISLGNFDRYMLPYYLDALKQGTSISELKEIMYEFYCLLNSYADGACALNVGPEYNEFSKFIIECQKEFAFPGPILAAHISNADDCTDILPLIDEKLFSRGQPAFYFEENCRAALKEKGVPAEKADAFAVESCMAFGVPGNELNSMWGCVLEMNLILNETVRGAVSGKYNIYDKASLIACFTDEAARVFGDTADVYEEKARECELNDPDVFVSAITESAVRKAADRSSGVTWHNVTVECIGLANTADGIGAVCELVFEKKKYTLKEMLAAVENNFAGRSDIRADILSCPAYGTGNKAADGIMAELMERIQKIIRSRDHGNLYYLPSLHTLDSNTAHGLVCGSGFDGRKAGEPLAKNAGPSNRVRKKDPSGLIISAGSMPQKKFYGGQPIDLHFSASDVRQHPEQLAAAIHVYGKLGGLQLQVNSVSAETLHRAVESPELYSDLVVRIGGYSCYFNSLSAESKKEFIERFEKEED